MWLLIRCWLLLPLCDSVIVLCFVVRYFVSILVLQSSWWTGQVLLLSFVTFFSLDQLKFEIYVILCRYSYHSFLLVSEKNKFDELDIFRVQFLPVKFMWLLIRFWLLLPLCDSVIVVCFVVRDFVSILVLQSSWWTGQVLFSSFIIFFYTGSAKIWNLHHFVLIFLSHFQSAISSRQVSLVVDSLLIVTAIVRFCKCCLFCCVLLFSILACQVHFA